MSEVAIKVESLGKSYFIGHRQNDRERYIALRDVIAKNTKDILDKTKNLFLGEPIVQGNELEEFWALDDINFEINAGERVGIIGRNGAGKSTLLKILSRITEPTTGRVTVNGRVASLLEVGTGFHPELTGRENIFLNGAILGMSRREIMEKFDEIVDFAEIEKFLDTPVKRYSSGMYVRLAFAVAAHLESEILLVDEVLAVGDVQFQKKCLGKMGSISDEGRTVLFVTHNTNAVELLTDQAILLKSGKLMLKDNTAKVLEKYALLSETPKLVNFDVQNIPRKHQTNQKVRFLSLSFDQDDPVFHTNDEFTFQTLIRAEANINAIRFSLTVFSADGVPVGSSFGPNFDSIQRGESKLYKVILPSPGLTPGKYYCAVAVGEGDFRSGYIDYDIVTDTLWFEVKTATTADEIFATWNAGWGKIEFKSLMQKRIL